MGRTPDPLMVSLAGLSVISGLVDAISFLGIGRVFTANMTGNIVILGFAAAGVGAFSVTVALASLAAFLAGAAVGGRLRILIADRRRLMLFTLTAEAVLLGIVALGALTLNASASGAVHAFIALLALAMGMRNAVIRQLAIPDSTTTVATGLVTGMLADSPLGTGKNTRLLRRLTHVLGILVGAVMGALMLRRLGLFPAITMTALGVALITVFYALRPDSRVSAAG